MQKKPKKTAEPILSLRFTVTSASTLGGFIDENASSHELHYTIVIYLQCYTFKWDSVCLGGGELWCLCFHCMCHLQFPAEWARFRSSVQRRGEREFVFWQDPPPPPSAHTQPGHALPHAHQEQWVLPAWSGAAQTCDLSRRHTDSSFRALRRLFVSSVFCFRCKTAEFDFNFVTTTAKRREWFLLWAKIPTCCILTHSWCRKCRQCFAVP